MNISDRPAPPEHNGPENVRDRIVNAALQLVDEGGVAAVLLDHLGYAQVEVGLLLVRPQVLLWQEVAA